MIDYLSSHMWQLWAGIAVLALILELTSGDFFIVCFAIGACGAAAVSPFAGIYVQLVVFGLVTAFSIFQVRPFALRYLHGKDEGRLSNAEALLGREGRVSETIAAGGYGYVAIDGDLWKARTADGQEAGKDTAVRVVDRQSTIITVEPILQT